MPNEPEKEQIDDAYQAAGSYQQGVQPEIARETMGKDAGTDAKTRESNGEKESTDTAGTNPKRTENSRPD